MIFINQNSLKNLDEIIMEEYKSYNRSQFFIDVFLNNLKILNE